MSDLANSVRSLADWFTDYCPLVPEVDVDALIADGVDAADAEDVADDVAEVNSAIRDLNVALARVVDADTTSDAALEEAFGSSSDWPSMEGLLLSGGTTVYDATDTYAERDNWAAHEALLALWNDISKSDDYAREVNTLLRPFAG